MVESRNDLAIIQLLSDKNRNKVDLITKISQLIELGEDVNQSLNGTTPLHLSIKFGYTKLTEILLKKGADKNISNNFNEAPIDYAKHTSNCKIMDLMFINKEKNIQNSLYQEVLIEKITKEEKRLILHVIKRGAKINKRDKRKNSDLLF